KIGFEYALRGTDHPGAGDQIPDAQPVPVEQRKEGEDPAPDEASKNAPAADAARVGEDKAYGQEQFELAHGVAREDGIEAERAAVARGHAHSDDAFAWRRAARGQLEGHEVEITQKEEAEHPDDDGHRNPAREARGKGDPNGSQRHSDQDAD